MKEKKKLFILFYVLFLIVVTLGTIGYVEKTIIPTGTLPVETINKEGDVVIGFVRKNALPASWSSDVRIRIHIKEELALSYVSDFKGNSSIMHNDKRFVSVLTNLSELKVNKVIRRLKVSINGSESSPDIIGPLFDADIGTVYISKQAIINALRDPKI